MPEQVQIEDQKWTLNDCRDLKQGWNGYSALPPKSLPLRKAEKLLFLLDLYQIEPCHFGPSAMGGIGFTFFNQDGVEYILEYLNNGNFVSGICDCGTSGGRCAELFKSLFNA